MLYFTKKMTIVKMTIVLLLTTSSNAIADEIKTGLPQLELNTYPSLIFWSVVSLAIGYLLMKYLVTPNIKSIFNIRETSIQNDLVKAKTSSQETEKIKESIVNSQIEIKSRSQSILNDAFPHLFGFQPDRLLAKTPQDMGLTHGIAFSSSIRIDGGDVIQLKLDKKLFTAHDYETDLIKSERRKAGSRQRRDDPNIREQIFTEEATYMLTWRHFMKNGRIYFDVGIGMQDLNRTKPKGFLSTPEQQFNWHKSNKTLLACANLHFEKKFSMSRP